MTCPPKLHVCIIFKYKPWTFQVPFHWARCFFMVVTLHWDLCLHFSCSHFEPRIDLRILCSGHNIWKNKPWTNSCNTSTYILLFVHHILYYTVLTPYSACKKDKWWKCHNGFLAKHFLKHIFPKAQVASKKCTQSSTPYSEFGHSFFILFHLVWSILLGVCALKTLKWKFLIGDWRI